MPIDSIKCIDCRGQWIEWLGRAPPAAAVNEGVPAAEFTAAHTSTVDLRLQSALICPLAVGDEVIGTIAVYHQGVSLYTEDHRRVLDQVAHQAASVVHNALIFEHCQEQALREGWPDGTRSTSARCSSR